MRRYIGLDIGGTKCASILGEKTCGRMEVLEKRRFETAAKSPDEVMSEFCSDIRRFRQSSEIAGIGISCGGPLDACTGVIQSPPNLPGWDNIPVVARLRERFDLPVYLQNDANACAVAEWKYGAGRGCENMIFLTFGTGLGAGLILGGRLYSGTNGMAGEAGHVRLAEAGPFGYGKEGSFEGFCSGGGIARQARARVAAGEAPELLERAGSLDAITAKLLGDLAEAGDAFSQSVYAETGRMLGRGLAILIDILNPQRIVIGSIFARSRALLWPACEAEIRREALPLTAGVCQILPAALGEAIGDIAALSVAQGE